MRKTTMLLAILTVFLLITTVSCSNQSEDYYIKNPTEAPSVATLNPNWTSMPQPTDAGGAELPGEPYDYINPERLFNIGEWMDIAGVQIRLNSVTFTKKLENMKSELMAPNGAYWRDMIDEEGNIYGNQSYVIMNIDISNQNEEETKICVGDFGLYQQVLDERQVATSFCYMEPSMYEGPDSSFYLIPSGETITFTHYSTLVNDVDMDNKELYFHIPSWDISTVPIVDTGWYYDYSVWVPMNQDKSEVDVYANYQDEHDYINLARIYNIGETVERDGMTFCVNNLFEEKKLEGISVNRMRYASWTKVDSDGTYDKGYYMRVNVTIKNVSNEERKLCTSAIYLADPHSGGFIPMTSLGITPSITTDLFYADFYNFQPGEEVTFDLYYLCSDSELTEENRVLYVPMSIELQDEVNPQSFYNNDFFVALKKDKSEVNIYGE